MTVEELVRKFTETGEANDRVLSSLDKDDPCLL